MKSKCLKLEASQIKKKKKKPLLSQCQVTPTSSQICNEVQKLFPWKGAGKIIFLRLMPKRYFFKLAKLSKYCLGVELAPVHQMIKMAQNRSFAGLRAVSHSMPQLLQNLIKKTKETNKNKTNKQTKTKTKRACHLLKF